MTLGGRDTWLLRQLQCAGFTLLCFGAAPGWAHEIAGLRLLEVGPAQPLRDTQGVAALRYHARPGTCYLIRPDQHVAARWRQPTAAKVVAALERGLGRAASRSLDGTMGHSVDSSR